tara:strand:- start:853 stop:1893 length:1041 start_codon:yes stop_codon:yes gene_type:complete
LENTWVIEAFVIVLGAGFAHLAARILFKRLEKRFSLTHNLYDDALLDAVRKPVAYGIWILGILWAAEVIGGNTPAEIFKHIDDLREVTVIWLLVWFAVRFIKFLEVHVGDTSYKDVTVDQTTAFAVGKLLRVAVTITGVLMVLQGLGFSVSGVLAFGGIGGIAVGFAARDLLANFFGALMIFLDRPFSVGDWIRSPDRDIEGTVEEIGWRQTRIRTFDERPLYVPNAIFNSLSVENPSRMRNRRIYETIGVRYADVEVLKEIVDEVEKMLRAHPDIDVEKTLMVNFVEFGPSSLDFFIYTFTRTIVWEEYHQVKQDVLFKVSDIIGAKGAEVAFPTQTINIEAEAE